MDLNRLYFQHQISTMRACAAHTTAHRRYHQAIADGFGRRIADIQNLTGADAAAEWAVLRSTAADRQNAPHL